MLSFAKLINTSKLDLRLVHRWRSMAQKNNSAKNTSVVQGRSRGRPAKIKDDSDVKNKIIEKALEVFSTSGFNGAGLRDIAEKAGVNHKMIHHYFGGKEELWRATVDSLFTSAMQIASVELSEIKTSEVDDRAKSILKNLVRVYSKFPEISLITLDAGNSPEREKYILDNYLNSYYEVARPLLEAAQDAGMIKNISPQYLFFIVTQAAVAPFAFSRFFNAVGPTKAHSKKTIEAYGDALAEVITHGVLIQD